MVSPEEKRNLPAEPVAVAAATDALVLGDLGWSKLLEEPEKKAAGWWASSLVW